MLNQLKKLIYLRDRSSSGSEQGSEPKDPMLEKRGVKYIYIYKHTHTYKKEKLRVKRSNLFLE
jgi:hypothetical protein